MKDINKIYFKTRSKIFAISIQFVTNKQYYKFTNEDKETVYSFEILKNEQEEFYNKLNKLQEIKFS